jgi:hypothetical protein
MLIGSDMPIFGDAEHPCISLRLHNSNKPINILTGMDYWLDNLMCQVSDVLEMMPKLSKSESGVIPRRKLMIWLAAFPYLQQIVAHLQVYRHHSMQFPG